MSRGVLGLAAAGLVGALLGAVLTLGLPSTGRQGEETSPARPDPSGVVAPGSASTLLGWTPGGLPSGYAAAVRKLEAVEAVAEVRSGTGWLSSWQDADGSVRRSPPGLRIPIEVAAVNPSSFRGFVPAAERAAFDRLARRGRALLGRSGAGVRGIGAGGRLTFEGSTIRVDGVVDDELIGAHEMVVSRRTGSALGISRPRFLLVEPREGASRESVERGLRRLLPRGVRLRVRDSGETSVFRQGDGVLPPVRLKEVFGEFAAEPASGGDLRLDPRWVARNIRTADVPILGDVRCHRRILPALDEGVTELIRRGLGDLVDPTDYGGCFAPRSLNRDPGAGISHHAWGVAFDINVSTNLRGETPQLSPDVVEVFEELGFTWGGRWLVPDGMHFEFLRFPPE